MEALTSHSLLAASSSRAWGAGVLGAQSLQSQQKTQLGLLLRS